MGDLIRVSNKQPLPADVVVLATGEDDNVCYIETSSIDGETNLKLRRYRTHTDKDQGKRPVAVFSLVTYRLRG